MTYLDKLKAHLSEKSPAGQPPEPPKPSLSGFSGAPSGRISPIEGVKVCRAGLGALKLTEPLHGLSAQRWRQLLDDAAWLLEYFGSAAFCDGWTVGELFGLWWWDDAGTVRLKPGWGGIADRLEGSRSLKLTDARANWRCVVGGATEQLNRGSYSNLIPLWESCP
jgi:hypothetical protein